MDSSQSQKDQLTANLAVFKARWADIKSGYAPAQQSIVEGAIAAWEAFIAALVVNRP